MNDLFGGQLASSVPASTVQSALRVGSSLFPPVAGVSSNARESVSGGSNNRASGGREAFPWYCKLVKTTMQQDAVAELIEQENLPASAVRKLLELVAQGIEKRGGNDAYIKAFKNAATFVRSYKPD